MTVCIELSRGYHTLIDNEDYEEISKYSWHVCPANGKIYVSRSDYSTGKHRTQKLHRQLLRCPKDLVVDHINGDPLDNRRCNIRVCTRRQNARNLLPKLGNTSKYKGVHWYKIDKIWRAQIKLDTGNKYLGKFKEELEAAKAYNEAAVLHYGEFARLNIIED